MGIYYTDKHRYDDIMHLAHHVSISHPHMDKAARAAQFAPFAALSGHKDIIKKTEKHMEDSMDNTDSMDCMDNTNSMD